MSARRGHGVTPLLMAVRFSPLRFWSRSPGYCAARASSTGQQLAARFEHGPADFSDYLILELAQQTGALPVRTFDERFAREADVELVALA